ncbi:MAG: DMT family transporter [Synergistaceae bacterium]|jgi:drug/metabolite transporter (DMT)-like permease|nr:DMT family transporter [Synergistaceae bacterium]
MRPATKGIIITIASAFIYGITPIMVRMTYDGGANGVTMTFLRALLCMPVFIALLAYMRVPFAVSRGQCRDLAIIVGIGVASTTLLMYVSYSYIPVGMATTLHFIYPVLVSASCVIFYRERLGAAMCAALALSAIGIFMTAGGVTLSGSAVGVGIALLSGCTYSFYLVRLNRSELAGMHPLKLSFCSCVVVALYSGIYGAFSGTLTFDLTAIAWLYSFIVSISVSIGAVTMLQQGVKLCGAPAASILSTFEPITSVALGVIVLGELLTLAEIAGGLCIIASVAIVTISSPRKT